jgi:hypothetical protein
LLPGELGKGAWQLPLSESAFSTRFRPFPVEIVEPFHTLTMDATTALAIYRAEKDKALRERRVSHVQLMAEAQEAFRKMLADAQLARKGGRPKGSTNAASAAPVAVTASAAVAVTGKLVLKTSKPTPPKIVEKVTVAASSPVKARTPAKAAPVQASAKPAKATKVQKRTAEKRRPAAKAKSPAKAAKRAAAPASRKGSAKKTAAPRKQAAARERKAKARRH